MKIQKIIVYVHEILVLSIMNKAINMQITRFLILSINFTASTHTNQLCDINFGNKVPKQQICNT